MTPVNLPVTASGSGGITYGCLHYPHATSILLLCDGGGSNSSRHHIFKQDLQALADEIGVEIRIAHYPPYCSKYNPIEHRLFPHLTRACQGVIFTSIDVVKHLMQKTQTSRGLKVFVHILDKLYQTGCKVADDFKRHMTLVHDCFCRLGAGGWTLYQGHGQVQALALT